MDKEGGNLFFASRPPQTDITELTAHRPPVIVLSEKAVHVLNHAGGGGGGGSGGSRRVCEYCRCAVKAACTV